MDTIIKKIYCNGITLLAFGILLILLIFSMISTCLISPDMYEVTFHVGDKVSFHLIIFIFLALIGFFLNKYQVVDRIGKVFEKKQKYFLILNGLLLLLIFLLSVTYNLSTNFSQGADQLELQQAAVRFLKGNYLDFAPKNYLDLYRNNIGYFLITLFFVSLFGENFMPVYLFNCICLTLFWEGMRRCAKETGAKEMEQLMMPVTGILFFPLMFYTGFAYGNIPGLTCGIWAIYFEMLFFKNAKWRDGVTSAVLIAVAVLFKQNYAVFLIGMVLYAIFKALSNRRIQFFTVAILSIGCMIAAIEIPLVLFRNITGYPLNQGASPYAHVAMGLRTSKRGEGWYDGSIRMTYLEAGGITKRQKEAVTASIKSSLQQMKEDPLNGLIFFVKKNNSQWLNPNYQCFWINHVHFPKVKTSWTDFIQGTELEYYSTKFLNFFQTLVLAGAILYLVFLRGNEEYDDSLVLLLIVVGGFLFHTFWEAKAQYIISYFVLLFPAAVMGWFAFGRKSYDVWVRIRKRDPLKSAVGDGTMNVILFLFAALVLGVVFVLRNKGILDMITSQNEEYIQYLFEYNFHPLF